MSNGTFEGLNGEETSVQPDCCVDGHAAWDMPIYNTAPTQRSNLGFQRVQTTRSCWYARRIQQSSMDALYQATYLGFHSGDNLVQYVLAGFGLLTTCYGFEECKLLVVEYFKKRHATSISSIALSTKSGLCFICCRQNNIVLASLASRDDVCA